MAKSVAEALNDLQTAKHRLAEAEAEVQRCQDAICEAYMPDAPVFTNSYYLEISFQGKWLRNTEPFASPTEMLKIWQRYYEIYRHAPGFFRVERISSTQTDFYYQQGSVYSFIVKELHSN